jgi:hypothetical protein
MFGAGAFDRHSAELVRFILKRQFIDIAGD